MSRDHDLPGMWEQADLDGGFASGIERDDKGTWWVYVDGQRLSDHATRDGAAIAYRNHL